VSALPGARSDTRAPSSPAPSRPDLRRRNSLRDSPAEVIITTRTICACRSNTSTWRTVRGLERRRRGEREQMRHLRQDLGCRLERLLDLVLGGDQVERKQLRLRPSSIGASRRSSGKRVGGTRPAEVCGCISSPYSSSSTARSARSRKNGEPAALDKRLEPTGSPSSRYSLDYEAQDPALAITQTEGRRIGICRNF